VNRKYSIITAHEPPDPDAPEIEVRIWFTFTPGCPEQGPSYVSGGEPATGPEVEFDSVERVDGIAAPELADWAAEYLAGPGFDRAMEEATDDGPDPDDARDRDQDDRMMGVGRYAAQNWGDEC
jgi:hypothetical protein